MGSVMSEKQKNALHCANDIKEFGRMFAMHDNRCI